MVKLDARTKATSGLVEETREKERRPASKRLASALTPRLHWPTATVPYLSLRAYPFHPTRAPERHGHRAVLAAQGETARET